MLLLIFACASNAPTYHEDVKPILEGRCISCHYDGGISGISFEDYESSAIWSKAIANAVEQRTMPPWPADSSVSYTNDWSLSESDIQRIVDWDAAGAPEGPRSTESSPLPPVGRPLSRVDLSLSMPEAYETAPDSGDNYRCFVLDWPKSGTSYITGFDAKPGNPAVVHHIAAFLIRPDGLMGESVFDSFAQWDADDPKLGYPCFGGPSGPDANVQVPIEQLAQWVPGGQGWDFPEGTGIEVPEGSKIILQLHYYAGVGIEDTADQTSIDLRLEENVQNIAGYAPWLNGSWPLGNMEIPAGDDQVSYEITGDPRSFFGLLNPNFNLDEGFRIHSMMLLMHRLGQIL